MRGCSARKRAAAAAPTEKLLLLLLLSSFVSFFAITHLRPRCDDAAFGCFCMDVSSSWFGPREDKSEA